MVITAPSQMYEAEFLKKECASERRKQKQKWSWGDFQTFTSVAFSGPLLRGTNSLVSRDVFFDRVPLHEFLIIRLPPERSLVMDAAVNLTFSITAITRDVPGRTEKHFKPSCCFKKGFQAPVPATAYGKDQVGKLKKFPTGVDSRMQTIQKREKRDVSKIS